MGLPNKIIPELLKQNKMTHSKAFYTVSNYQINVLQTTGALNDLLALFKNRLGSLSYHGDAATQPPELEARLRRQPGAKVVRWTGGEEGNLQVGEHLLEVVFPGESESGRNQVHLVKDENDVLPIRVVVGEVVQRRWEGRTPGTTRSCG